MKFIKAHYMLIIDNETVTYIHAFSSCVETAIVGSDKAKKLVEKYNREYPRTEVVDVI